MLARLLNRLPNSVVTDNWLDLFACRVALAMLIAALSLDPSSSLVAGRWWLLRLSDKLGLTCFVVKLPP